MSYVRYFSGEGERGVSVSGGRWLRATNSRSADVERLDG
jgi:hypothetical protein